VQHRELGPMIAVMLGQTLQPVHVCWCNTYLVFTEAIFQQCIAYLFIEFTDPKPSVDQMSITHGVSLWGNLLQL